MIVNPNARRQMFVFSGRLKSCNKRALKNWKFCEISLFVGYRSKFLSVGEEIYAVVVPCHLVEK